MLKKIISFLVLICMVILMPSSIVTYAYNTGNDYPYKASCAGCHTISNSDHSDIDPWKFYYRQCTSFVAWCLNSRNGINFTNQYGGVARWGHGKDWATAARSLGILVDNNPAVGSVAYSTSGEYGHVAWVKSVNGNNVTVEEYNWETVGGFGVRTKSKSYFTGYIHIKDLSEHTHSYTTYKSTWATHPHYKCYQCSCGDVKERTSEPTFSLTCSQCTKHTLLVDPDGGTWNGSDKTQTITKNYNDTVEIPRPTRDGYSFTGWIMQSFGGTRFNDADDLSNSSNNINIYNNAGNNTVTHDYIDKPADCPTETSNVLKITKSAGESRPGLGGFKTNHYAASNNIFYHVIVAKIPKGYTINHGNNFCGDKAEFIWITSQEGTGEWETYIHKTVCGSSGQFDNDGLGFIYIAGPDATEENPVTWYVGYTNIFDATNINDKGTGVLSIYGWSIFDDTLFEASNSISIYNNAGNSNVSIKEISDAEIPGKKIFKITTNGYAKPSLGGFIQGPVASAANKIFYQVIRAKIPKGYTIKHGNNFCGDKSEFTWITSQKGTGEWETYIHKTVCGSSGQFDNRGLGFIYIDGPAATEENPVTWYVEYSNIFDATGTNAYDDNYNFLYGNDMLTATWKKNSTIKPIKEAIYENNRYELYEGNYSWSDAKKICEERGGHLVTITAQDENNAIQELIQDTKDSQYWIGATNEENQAIWEWVTDEEFNYNNWATGVPDNGNGEFSERYAQIYKNGTWDDAKDYVITSSRGFICEYENSKNASCITTLNYANIAKGKYKISSNIYNISSSTISGRCYIALYNNQKKLLTLIDGGVINLESKKHIEVIKEITASVNDTVKVFVWETNLNPLSNVISIKISDALFD